VVLSAGAIIDQIGNAFAGDSWSYTLGVVLVDDTATGAGTGLNWTDAFNDLQDGIDATGGGVAEIWVAQGAYLPSALTDPNDPRTATFKMGRELAFYGGLAGDEDPATFDLADRDIEAHPTILSGDLGVVDDTSDNAYRVVVSIQFGSTSRLDGFIVTKGNQYGGLISEHGAITISHCTFTENVASSDGGGLLSVNSDLIVEHCTFVGNTSQNGDGGGMVIISDSSATITDTLFQGNVAGHYGGGLAVQGQSTEGSTIAGCSFVENTAEGGGGLHTTGQCVSIVDCAFRGNAATGAIGGGGVLNYTAPVTLVNCLFSANRAPIYGVGGAIANMGPITMTNCTFSANQAGDGGAVRHNASYTPHLTNCILFDDVALSSPYPELSASGATPHVSYTCIEGGWSGTGNTSVPPMFVRAPDDGGDGWGDNPATPGIDEGANDDYGDLHLQAGSPSIDEGYNAADTDYYHSGVQLLPSTDLDGYSRIVDGDHNGSPIVDRGAYEWADDQDGDGVPDTEDNCPSDANPDQDDDDGDSVGDACDLCPNTPFGEPVDSDGCSLVTRGDLDCDDDVDLNDLAILVAAMNGPNQPPGIPSADLDRDLDCDLADFVVFQANFTGPL
jgi:predicted outer membrane repeat protein